MKKYIAPSVEIVNVKTMSILEVSVPFGSEEGPHKGESKNINFADDNASFWSTEQ